MGGEGNGIASAEAASALGWWLEAGVDVAIQEEPRDWLKVESPAAESVPVEAPPEQQLPETLDGFRDWLATAPGLPLASAGARRVLPLGPADSPVMLLADAPSAEDAGAGRPIGGEAWELTERMLAAIGLSGDEAYVANISCFHVPGMRMTARDLESCAAIARRQVALGRPRRLLLFGDGPALALLGKPVAAARGHVHRIEGVRTVATFHPRFLINRPSDKSLAWKDLLLLMEDSR